jgi:hypothetical protein
VPRREQGLDVSWSGWPTHQHSRSQAAITKPAEKPGIEVVILMEMAEITCSARKSRPGNFDRDRQACPSNHSIADTLNRI